MAKFDYEDLITIEERLQFSHFNRTDAFALGMLVNEEAGKLGCPIAVEIVLNGLVVFRYFQDGCPAESNQWLKRKRNTVESQGIGSLRFGLMLEKNCQTLEDNKMDPADHAPGGGGMPVLLEGTGMIGSVCVSGCPNHLDDQEIVVNAMTRLLENQR
ncbi:MAG: heme-binding protein [Lachnospiraceae bacterium]|nr:heme-binding protein [Lachnospiraceae bacterium]